MDKAILVTSFGTSYDMARQRDIEPVVSTIQSKYPAWQVCQAYTSRVLREKLGRRGVVVHSVEEALERFLEAGIRDVVIQPTMIAAGTEFDKVKQAAAAYENRFHRVAVGSPLLVSTDDLLQMANALANSYACAVNQALVMMGHGTPHGNNMVYAALNYACTQQGYSHIFVGTAKAYPNIDIVARAVKRAEYSRVRLAPLMLVAGEHALEDMAGADEDSWKSCLQAQGLEVEVALEGLGSLAKVQSIYLAHLADAMEKSAIFSQW